MGWRLAVTVALAALCAPLSAALPARGAPQGAPARIPSGPSHYLESCGGCHGITGESAKRDIPQIKDRVGRFLCTNEGRSYAVQLPNVAFSAMSNEDLAGAMNYIMFTLGGDSAPRDARPYTAAEVAALRRKPLKATDLVTTRARVLGTALMACEDQGR